MIILFISGIIILALVVFFLAKSFYQSKVLKKSLSKTQFELVSVKQGHQVVAAELADLKQKFTQQILTDSLTGLVSRHMLEDRLSQTLNQSKRYQLIFAVMFLDIDEFKTINDVLGYDVGDELLQQVARRLERSVRLLDTLSRFSGDNFVLVLPQLAKAEVAVYIAQRLLDAIAQPFPVRGQDLYITASVGIAIYPNDGDEAKILLKNADSAVNQAKLRGRNSFQFYRQEMHEQSRRELLLSSSLRNPDIYNEFVLYYQPQFNAKTKKIMSVETVLNWQHADFGFVSPIEFLRLAEHSGKILEIGEWILRQALTQFQEWSIQGIFLEKMAINVSLRQLESSHFIYKISQILQELHLSPSQLVLEVSESTLSARVEHIEKTFNMLKHLGVQVAISHFGTGNLSLQCIEKLSIDYLKIDQSLISEIANKNHNQAIVKMVIAIAKNLNLSVIAEGVNEEAQEKLLIELGCDILQGSLFGPLKLGKEITSILS